MAELVYVAAPTNLIRRGSVDGEVLIEARQRVREASGEPKGAEQENAFAVVDVVQQLAHGPLLGFVTIKRFLFRDAGQKRQRFLQLQIQGVYDVVAGNEINVASVVRCGFAWLRAA